MTARNILKSGFEYIEAGFDAAFGAAWNPLYQLGALGWLFFWVVLVSGIYLFIFFDTGVINAYQSVEYMTHEQWYLAGVMRSLHRFASDALVLVMLVHLLREFGKDRYRGKRWFAWITGVPMLWFVYICGISGYWLVWDTLAQYIAVATSEWLDTLPFFGEPIARNFLNSTTLSGRFFTLMVFIHLVLPLFLLIVMWIHIQRNAFAKVNPTRGLSYGTLLMLLILSLVYPAVSQAPANLDVVPASVNLDWFYLPAYPLLEHVSGLWLWVAFALATLLLMAVPWMPPLKHQPLAVVSLANCNGCARCYDDCPFNAIVMQDRSDDLPYEQEAVIKPTHCVGCGICTGACPTATPFRRAGELIPGVDLVQLPIRELREQTIAAAQSLSGNSRVIVYGCDFGPNPAALKGDGIAPLALRCVAMLPPSFLDFVLSRGYADGVYLCGCRDCDCHFRLGIDWAELRLAGKRDPYLRKRVERERIATSWVGVNGVATLHDDIKAFQERLRGLDAPHSPEA